MTDFEEIRAQAADGVLTITLNRPDRLNAFTETMRSELIAAFDARRRRRRRARRRSSPARAAASAPAPTSRRAATRSTGASARPPTATTCRATAAARSSLRIFDCTKPVIAAINGPAVGVGITMTLPMDIRLAADGREDRLRLRAPRDRARGVLELVPAAHRRHQPGDGVGRDRPRLRRPGGAGGRPRAQRPRAGRAAAAPRTRSRARSPTTRRRCRSRSAASCCGGCSAPTTRWRPTAPTRARCTRRGQSADAREGVQSFLEKRPAAFPDRVSGGLPELFG